ncbi:relaxase/mobilization nuclease domain-containing protein [Sphingopyxis sp. Geo48]|uniref:relaxase/mobilization nuclease domain-containing protein n=1 Tax=Sphingopyxis sp. Geo48 TaxID=545241 RepID=UPI0024B686B3|nr:relaxase/mobilization nuclease domain-containing protein [Sphingopyxis sp. Geo48]
MILKGSQRSGGKQLGLHLLKTEENEHVEIHEVSGFISDTVMGAMNEAYALARGTKCQQYLFSLSLSPPALESVRVETFEKALSDIEERLGLIGQPRIVVFHEKEGRRHCHAVWSRIDADTMTAKELPFFKNKLNEIGKQLYLENGWAMPKGFESPKLRNPSNFTLDEWQQAKRAGLDPRELKSAVQDCWKHADSVGAFAAALEERGLFLARGDRRGFVAINIDGDVFAISRLIGGKAKDVAARLGDPSRLPSVDDARVRIASDIAPRLSRYIAEAKRIARTNMEPLIAKREALKVQHQAERQAKDKSLSARWDNEQRTRAARIRKGFTGAWDILTGRYFRTRKQNEMEAKFARERDSHERQALIQRQLQDRQALQDLIRENRRKEAERILSLYRDAAAYRRMQGERDKDRGHGSATLRPKRDRGLDLG